MKEDYGALYTAAHNRSQKRFPGYSICPYVDEIADLVERTGAKRLLDYGSGRGMQYLVRRVHERWGGILPHCYDVGVLQLSVRPEGAFDGVIATDVLEHIAEEDVDEVLADIFSFVSVRQVPAYSLEPPPASFAFFSIACRQAGHKKLPDGRNVHLTVRPPEWWDRKLRVFERDGLIIRTVYDEGEESTSPC